MPLIPNALERLVLLTANQGPGPSLDLFGAVGFRTGIAASKIGLFEALETGPDQTPSNLAKQLGLDERAVRSLMALLESLGYLRSRSGSYRLTKTSSLAASSALSVSYTPLRGASNPGTRHTPRKGNDVLTE